MMQIDFNNTLSDPRSASGDDPGAAHARGCSRCGCANNRGLLVLRWDDHDEIK